MSNPTFRTSIPPDQVDDPGLNVSQEPAFTWFAKKYFGRDIPDQNGSRILFVLADAGMGKTSLLLSLMRRHWEAPLRPGFECELMKLGPDSLDRIRAIPNPARTFLLLDSLDEDPEAHRADGGAAGRLREILRAVNAFHRVVITCRTQFFPETSPHLLGSAGHFSIDSLACPLKYLSLFDDEQVEKYLTRRFEPTLAGKLLRAIGLGPARSPLERAREAAGAMESLRLRPLLLTHIDDFVGQAGRAPIDYRNTYVVYEHLVNAWLRRERADNKPGGMSVEEGWRVAVTLALHLTRTNRKRIARAELTQVPGLENVERFKIESRSLVTRTTGFDFQFAHSTFQEFLVAHALLMGKTGADTGAIRLTQAMIRFLVQGLSLHLSRSFDPRGVTLTDGGGELMAALCPSEVVHIEAGRFLMGSPGGEPGRFSDEVPRHEVTLTREFWIGRFPVTQAEFERVMGRNPSRFKGLKLPVENVSWDDAMEFCRRLGDIVDPYGTLSAEYEFRLPTEAEWEYACRAGTSSAFNDGSECSNPDSRDPALDRLGWFLANSGSQTHPVGEKQPNAWGLQDMHGNVWEWCLDRKRVYRKRHETDPLGPTDGARHVARGGSYSESAGGCRSACRDSRDAWESGNRDKSQGFRLVLGPRVGGGATEREAGPRDEDQPDRSRRGLGLA